MDARGRWTYDANAPLASVDATHLQPVVQAFTPAQPSEDEHDGHDLVHPDAFPNYDEIDSRSILDDGGPDAA